MVGSKVKKVMLKGKYEEHVDWYLRKGELPHFARFIILYNNSVFL